MELGNGLVRFVFDDATGSLARITDLTNEQEYLTDPRHQRLFCLIAPTDEHLSRPVYSHLAGRPQMACVGDTLTITYPDLKAQDHNGELTSTGISARVTVSLPAGRREARFLLTVDNDGPVPIHEVQFPWVAGWTGIAGEGVDEMILGTQRLDPHAIRSGRCHTFGRHNQKQYVQMGGLGFCDLSGGGRGLSYSIYTQVPRVSGVMLHDLSPDYGRVSLSWAYVNQPHVRPGASYTTPEVGIGVHEGDWHASADLYRRFVDTWWQAPPVPRRLRTAIAVHNIQFRGFNGEFYHDFREIPEIVQDCLDYGVRDLCLWDYIAQVYLRPDEGTFWETSHPQGGTERLEALRRGLAEAKRKGCNISTLVNLRLITERCRQYEELAPEVQVSAGGVPLIDSWPCSMHHGQYWNPNLGTYGHPLCQSTPGFRRFAYDLVRRTLDLGFTSLFIDQATDWRLCFAEHHEHASPDDTKEGALQWLVEAARTVRTRDEDAYLIGELPELFNTQALDVWWDWSKREGPSEVIRYLLPDSIQAWCIDEHERDVVSKAFASGHLLATMNHEMSGLLSDEPSLARQLERLGELRQRTAGYVAFGRFFDHQGLSVEGGEGYVYSSDKGLAVALANPLGREALVRVSLEADELADDPRASRDWPAAGPSGRGTLIHEDGSARSLPEGARHHMSLETTLPAYGAAVWTIPCGES